MVERRLSHKANATLAWTIVNVLQLSVNFGVYLDTTQDVNRLRYAYI